MLSTIIGTGLYFSMKCRISGRITREKYSYRDCYHSPYKREIQLFKTSSLKDKRFKYIGNRDKSSIVNFERVIKQEPKMISLTNNTYVRYFVLNNCNGYKIKSFVTNYSYLSDTSEDIEKYFKKFYLFALILWYLYIIVSI